MKFVEKLEDDGKKGSRYSFVLGRDEAVIMQRLLSKAVRFMPKTLQTAPTESRMRNMLRAIDKAIPKMTRDSADNNHRPE